MRHLSIGLSAILAVFPRAFINVQAAAIPLQLIEQGKSENRGHAGINLEIPVGLSASPVTTALPVTTGLPYSACNGSSANCDRRYGSVTFIGAHNFFAISKDGASNAAHQNVGVADQLNAGVRLLQGEVHNRNQQLELCTNGCSEEDSFSGGLLLDHLKEIKNWLDTHPNEVLTLIFTNSDNSSLEKLWKPAFFDSGLQEMIYVPSSKSIHRNSWPTLKHMIDSNNRVVVFVQGQLDENEDVPFFMPLLDNVQVTQPENIDSSTLHTCQTKATNDDLHDKMYLLNHYLTETGDPSRFTPARSEAQRTNSVASIEMHAKACAKLAGHWPNFILLDWTHIGTAFDALR
ncbi:hypothetical protein FRC03_011355, partial [Tulasnella sp. 419]